MKQSLQLITKPLTTLFASLIMASPLMAQTVEAILTNTTKTAFENKSYTVHESATLTLTAPFSVDHATNGDFRAVVQTMDIRPQPNAIVDRNQNITIETVENVTSGSLNNGVRIEGAYQGKINGSWSVSGTVATFTPTDTYWPNEKIMITVDPTMTSSSPFWLDQKGYTSFIAKSDPATTNMTTGQFLFQSSSVVGLEVLDIGDFDLDGILEFSYDFASSNSASSYKTRFREASYDAPSTTVSTFGDTKSFVPVDLDEDGDIDILRGRKYYGASWFENTGSGYTSNSLSSGEIVSYGDFDFDGDLDAVSLNEGYSLRFYRNNGSEQFTTETLANTVLTGAVSLLTDDFNADGYLDIIISKEGNSSITLFSNNGTGSFSSNNLSNSATGIEKILSADFDSDGDLDIVGMLNNTLKIYWNNGTGGIGSESTIVTNSQNFSCMDIGDLNGDGWIDIIAGSEDDNIYFIQNNSGTFSSSALNVNSDGVHTLKVGDFDDDGTIDLIYSTVTPSNRKITRYWNTPSSSARPAVQPQEEVVDEIVTVEEPISTIIFPNPFRDKITLQLEDFQGATATVLDVSGRILTTPVELESSSTEIDMTGIDGNVFLLYINKPTGPVTWRIMKEN